MDVKFLQLCPALGTGCFYNLLHRAWNVVSAQQTLDQWLNGWMNDLGSGFMSVREGKPSSYRWQTEAILMPLTVNQPQSSRLLSAGSKAGAASVSWWSLLMTGQVCLPWRPPGKEGRLVAQRGMKSHFTPWLGLNPKTIPSPVHSL